MGKVSTCKAKDPKTCRYHGAVIRMEDAKASGDGQAYLVAKAEVDKIERERFVTVCLKDAKTSATKKRGPRVFNSEEVSEVAAGIVPVQGSYISAREFVKRLGYRNATEEEATEFLTGRGIDVSEVKGVWCFPERQARRLATR